ncbi:hypothetical protein PV328_011878, partial [Microctonus aethiopoides]
ANEVFNHSVTRKFPKNKNFSMSSSGDTRVACAVLAKNGGNSYLKDVKESLNLDVNLETSGRDKNSDILQIAAIADKQIFSVYIRPTQPIGESASKRKFPERRGNGMFKLSKLAEDLLQTNLCTENFHEGIYDGIVLQDLVNKYLTADDLFDHAITFVESLKDFINEFKVASKEKSLLPTKDVSKYMMKKLARMETYDQLKEIYKSGEDSLLSFLSQKVDKQPPYKNFSKMYATCI